MTHILRYNDLCRLKTFDERFNYVMLNGSYFEETFGLDRRLNQVFYSSKEWRALRNHIIVRDNGCDLGVEDREIQGRIYIHHLNPITLQDIESRSEKLLDPDNLICVSFNTHQAITYGDKTLLPQDPIVRSPHDTSPWRK